MADLLSELRFYFANLAYWVVPKFIIFLTVITIGALVARLLEKILVPPKLVGKKKLHTIEEPVPAKTTRKQTNRG